MADKDDVKVERLASWLGEIADGLDRSHDVAKTGARFGPCFVASHSTVDSAVGYLFDLGFPVDALRLKRTFDELSREWFCECATDHVEKHPEDAASWVETFGSFPVPPQTPTERQAQQDRRLILGQGAKNLAEFVRALRRDVCQPANPLPLGTGPAAEPAEAARDGEDRGKQRVTEPPRKQLAGEARALALLVQHPEWTDTAIADAVPCNRTTLYSWPKFMAAKGVLKQGRQEKPRGTKDKDGSLEAW